MRHYLKGFIMATNFTLDAARAAIVARQSAPATTAPAATVPAIVAPASLSAFIADQSAPMCFQKVNKSGKIVTREFHTVEGLLSASPADRATVQYQSLELNHASGNYLKVARIVRDMAPKLAPAGDLPTNKVTGCKWLEAFVTNVVNKSKPSKAVQSLAGFVWSLENPAPAGDVDPAPAGDVDPAPAGDVDPAM